jgi:hypothetical protein
MGQRYPIGGQYFLKGFFIFYEVTYTQTVKAVHNIL